MFAEHGAIELIFLAAVALIVVGPKDLPVLMRKVGQFTAKMRGLATEFRSSFEELARQSELDELRKEVEALRQGQLGLGEHQTEIEQHFDELHHSFYAPAEANGDVRPPVSHGREDEEEQPELPFRATAAPSAAQADLAPPEWSRLEAEQAPEREIRA